MKESKVITLQVRVSQKELAAIERAADLKDMRPSTLVREAAMRYVHRVISKDVTAA